MVAASSAAAPRTTESGPPVSSPRAFDRLIDRPVSTNDVDLPEGALVMHELLPDRHVSFAGSIPARNGQTIGIPGTPQVVELVSVSEALRNAVLRIRAR